ncbi:LIC_10202 family protein [Leptospira bouyouniensis]|uniref:LIC_10202 family protein n=1 Tax=Leptospira bouyouniensis TaxID=2484911 RepID=UPI001091748B|nr:hypothetical protein [Leptospira bouyouniensis]TGM87362.1 hypothetical protein EHQ99_02380 [Leptospira bouyouniensis]
MEDKKKFNPSPFVEIRDPQLNVQEIVETLESKIPLDPNQNNQWTELTKINYKPESPLGFRKFDPAGTAHLFEKGISSPKFSNPKFWYIRGPVKFIINRLISVYGQIDKKLSENRIRAFFSVLHELIRLGKRLEQMERRFDVFYRDHLLHTNQKSSPNFSWATNSYFIDAGINPNWEVAVEDLKHSKQVLVLFPEWGEFLKQLSISKIPFQAVTSHSEHFDFIKSKVSHNVYYLENLFPLTQMKIQNFDILVYLPLNKFPTFVIERLFSEITSVLTKGNHVYFSVSVIPEDNHRPFRDLQVSEINLELLPDYLNSLGLNSSRDLTVSEGTKVFRYTKY